MWLKSICIGKSAMSARFIGHTITHRTSRLGIPWKTPSGRDLKKLEFSRLEKRHIIKFSYIYLILALEPIPYESLWSKIKFLKRLLAPTVCVRYSSYLTNTGNLFLSFIEVRYKEEHWDHLLMVSSCTSDISLQNFHECFFPIFNPNWKKQTKKQTEK